MIKGKVIKVICCQPSRLHMDNGGSHSGQDIENRSCDLIKHAACEGAHSTHPIPDQIASFNGR